MISRLRGEVRGGRWGGEEDGAPGADRPETFSPENWKGLEGCLERKTEEAVEDTGVT